MGLTTLLLRIAVTLQLTASAYDTSIIDVHHHYVPDFYAEALTANGGDPSGWPTPSWNVSLSEAFMAQIGVRTTILSLTSPGAPVVKNNTMARALARRANQLAASIRDQKPSNFGFFAALPNLLDTEGSLAEIKFALDNLKADGVTLFSRYGEDNYYLGHPEFNDIWNELNARKAVVFVHPTSPVDTDRVNPSILLPIIDYPHETTRTALDLLSSGNIRKFPNTTIILSHAGGNLPWLVSRIYEYKRGLPTTLIPDGISYNQSMDEFRSFYFDLALSCSPEKLDYLFKMIPHDHILYGSDYPYAPSPSILNFRSDLEAYPMSPELRQKVYFENALSLLPRLQR